MGNRHRGLDSCQLYPAQSLSCPGGEELEVTGPGVLYLRAIRLEQKSGDSQSLYLGILPPPPRAKALVLQILSATNYNIGRANVRGAPGKPGHGREFRVNIENVKEKIFQTLRSLG